MTITQINKTHWGDILKIQAKVYSQIEPEPLVVLQSKWYQSPEHCLVYVKENRVLAYLLAHAWCHEAPPKLSQPLPPNSHGSILFLHDLAVSQSLTGQGIGRTMVNHLLQTDAAREFKKTKLVAIQKSKGFWQKMGFKEASHQEVGGSYGNQATLMEQTRAT